MQLAWLKVGCIFYFPLKYKTKKGVPPHSEMIFKSNTMKNTLQIYTIQWKKTSKSSVF